MTKEEFLKSSSLKKGTLIETNTGSIRELFEFVEKNNRFGMRFKGIKLDTNEYNKINKYIYLDEINEVLDFLKANKKITFNKVADLVNADKKGNCVTHLTIEIISKFLKIGIVDYSYKTILLNG